MNEREALPEWANEEFEKLSCIKHVGNFMLFILKKKNKDGV